MIEVRPGSICVFADIGCPWARLAAHRLHVTRERLGLEQAVWFDMRAFPLELFNQQPTPKDTLDAETPAVAALEPKAGWAAWDDEPWRYPVTTLLAMEAVHAATEQGGRVAERLDLALRAAFFRDSRCISLHHVVVAVAREVEGLDVKALEEALVEGRFRARIFEDQEIARGSEVEGSPHLFLAGGSSFHNPGIEFTWEGEPPERRVNVLADEREIYEEILRRAAEDRGGRDG